MVRMHETMYKNMFELKEIRKLFHQDLGIMLQVIYRYTLFDREFHKFALDNYRVFIEYDKKNNEVDIMEIK